MMNPMNEMMVSNPDGKYVLIKKGVATLAMATSKPVRGAPCRVFSSNSPKARSNDSVSLKV